MVRNMGDCHLSGMVGLTGSLSQPSLDEIWRDPFREERMLPAGGPVEQFWQDQCMLVGMPFDGPPRHQRQDSVLRIDGALKEPSQQWDRLLRGDTHHR